MTHVSPEEWFSNLSLYTSKRVCSFFRPIACISAKEVRFDFSYLRIPLGSRNIVCSSRFSRALNSIILSTCS